MIDVHKPTTFVTSGSLVVCSVEKATRYLMSTNTRDEVDAIISIADNYQGKRPPKEGFYRVLHRLALTFDDVSEAADDNDIVPGREHAEAIARFVERATVRDGRRMVVHCHAGVSRSTAAALIVLASRGLRGDELRSSLIACCENDPWPNRTLARHGDDVLGTGDEIVKVAQTFHDTKWEPA